MNKLTISEQQLLDLAKEANQLCGETKMMLLEALKFTNGLCPLHDKVSARIIRV